MNIIVDTHIFLWSLAEPHRISKARRMELETMANTVYVSSVTVAELMIKDSIGKLDIQFDPVDMARQSGFDLLDFSADDALLLMDLPFHHRDPFDRMLVCQALNHGWQLMSDDQKISLYGCQIM